MQQPDSALPVYLVHWRRPDWCALAVASLLESDIPVDVTVIDNDEDPSELQRQLPAGTRIVSVGTNRGYTGGANVALSLFSASDAHVAVIGAHDLHVDPAALRHLRDAAARHPRYGILGPVLDNKLDGASSLASADRGEQVADDPDVATVEWISGTCMMITRECIETIGGFDEAYGSYTEDYDFSIRAGRAGLPVAMVRPAVAWGLGSGHVTIMRRAELSNLVRARYLADGRVAGLQAMWRLISGLARCSFGSVVPGRSPEQRDASRKTAVAHLGAFRDLGVTFKPRRTKLDPAGAAALPTSISGT